MPLPLTFFRIPRTAAAPSAAPSVNGMCQNCTWDIFHIVRVSCGRLFFLCPGVPLGRQPHGPPPPPKKPTALPTEETPRPVHSPSIEKTDKSAAFLLPRASVFAIFIRGPPAVELPFAASAPRSRAPCRREKGINPAWPRPRHILYTVCIPLGRKKHNKITRRKPRILDSSFGLLYQRLTPL